MFKLLIVDDERLDREGLKNQVDWASLNITTVTTAKNGFDAMKMIDELHPDILISDIKMPGMDGLTLAQKAHAAMPGIKIIFTSGFDDFDYVRSALKMDALEYILKPVDTSEITHAVKKALEERLKEKNTQEEWSSLMKQVNESKPLVKKKLWKDFLSGASNKELVLANSSISSEGSHYLILLCEMDDYKSLSMDEARSFDTALGLRIEGLLNEMTDEELKAEWVGLEEGKSVVVFCFAGSMSSQEIRDYVRCVAKRMLAEGSSQPGLSITIGIGCEVSQLEDLPLSYVESVKAVGQKMFVGKGGILFYYPKTSAHNMSIDIQDIGGQLMQSISSMDANKACYYIDFLFDSIESGNIYDKKYVQNCCFNIISRIDITLADMNEKLENIFGENEVLWDKLFRFETILDIRQWIKNVFRAVIEYLETRNAKKNRKTVDAVVKFVEENFGQEITLKNIANELYYSPNHLGYLFKEVYGQGFVEYLTEFRMKKAGELLKTSRKKMYEIAGMVGYKNMSSFINQFKIYYSMTPTEYRERM